LNVIEVLAMVAPMIRPLTTIACALALSAFAGLLVAQPADIVALQLEAKIPLGDVRGRIDHMAIDLARQHLFVAELENNSVGIVDLANRKVIRTIQGLREPQGVAFVPSMGTLYVANAGDGSLRLFLGPEYTAMGQIELGDDADNIRVDSATNHLFVGYGSGGLAEIDTAYFKKGTDIPLGSHPEGFQLDPNSNQIFVNLPKARAIAVVDRQSGKQTASWPMRIGTGNFPMALNQDAGHVLAAFRTPTKLGVFSIKDGALIASPDICGDADDVFVDAKRHRVYISCGQGFLDVLSSQENAYKRISRIPTVSGARTSLFVPELDRLLLAVRAASGEPASVWIFRPLP
jgi:YVTN family beta-propeller protein